MKKCSKCKSLKNYDTFYKDIRRKDGLSSICKDCQKELQIIYHRSDKSRLYRRDYYNYKYHNNINFKLSRLLRSRLRLAIRNNIKNGSAVKNLGCSLEEFKLYLESKFKDGMDWNNMSFYGWHIDHIIPLSSFNLTDENEFKKACHFTNLQPLWMKDNFKKGKKLN